MKQQSPLLRIWELGEKEHGRLIGAIVLAAVGVIGGMVPILQRQDGRPSDERERDLSVYLIWGGVAMAGYAAKTLLYTFALSLSHAATFAVLKEIRQKILEKLPRFAARNGDRHLQRQVKADHCRSGGRHGDHTGASAAGNDVQSAGTRTHPHLSVCAGLENGTAVTHLHPGRTALRDEHHGQL